MLRIAGVLHPWLPFTDNVRNEFGISRFLFFSGIDISKVCGYNLTGHRGGCLVSVRGLIMLDTNREHI